jgi:hypothetical protein
MCVTLILITAIIKLQMEAEGEGEEEGTTLCEEPPVKAYLKVSFIHFQKSIKH